MDEAFTLPSAPARNAHHTATRVAEWIKGHPQESRDFEQQLTTTMRSKCLGFTQSSLKVRRERMWSAYHSLRTSDTYDSAWKVFLHKSGVTDASGTRMFTQYVGDHMFRALVKLSCPLEPASASASSQATLTYEETNALRYAAGWIPRALKKQLTKSTHPLSKDLKLCLLDLLDDGDEDTDDTKAWVDLVNRGGLTRVNDLTFEAFLAMEQEVRKHLTKDKVPRLGDDVKQAVIDNDDVQFYWSMISADWEPESAAVLLEMAVSQWVKIRGFSFASGWVEEFKVSQKKTLQKSKGVRKQLLPKPKKAKTDDTTEQ